MQTGVTALLTPGPEAAAAAALKGLYMKPSQVSHKSGHDFAEETHDSVAVSVYA